MGAALTPHRLGVCEDKAQLERSYKEAEAAFDTVRTAIRQKVGKSFKNEYVILARAEDLAWYRLQHAAQELATHIREHGCGMIQEASPSQTAIW